MVTVNNVAPVVDAGADQTVNEGDTVNVNATFTDAGSADTHTATIDWGDGTPVDTVDPATSPVAGSHVYADNGVYTVQVTVTDDDSGVGSDTLEVTVNNVAPVVDAGADQTVDEGDTVNLDPATFSDAGTGDTHTATIDWGDGSPAEAGTVDQANDTVSGSHVYADNGGYTVQVTVTDDDGGVDSDTLIVTVNDVLPTNVDAHGPYNGIAGQPVSLTGSATCASVDTCTYAWDLDNDGDYDDATGQSPSHTWNTVGDYTIGLQVTDDDGNPVTDSADVHISGETHSIGLEVGWNLVSFNLQPVSTVITDVLSSIEGNYDLVYAWDAPSEQWLKYDPGVPYGDTLTNLDETMGFWIQMTSADTLDVVGSVPTTTDINLYSAGAGWNLVGYPSAVNRDLPGVLQDHGVGTDFSLVYAYHANDLADQWKLFDRTGPEYANDLTYLSPGWGYWVKVSADHTWDVAYSAP
jgi:PKD repeat protein